MTKILDITSEKEFLQYIQNKTDVYKYIIDNYVKKEITIEIPYIYSVINIKKNKKDLNRMLEYFIKKEEYEYAEKTKKLISKISELKEDY